MADLYNVETRTPEAIDDQNELNQAILQGTHQFPVGQSVQVQDPDGNYGTVPSENLQQAVSSGFKVLTPSQASVRDYVKANDNLSGTAKVALGQFADEAFMGLPELIYDKTGDPLEVAKKDALKKQHELANTVGGVAGFGASLVNPVTNPVFRGASAAGEAVAKSIAQKLAVTSGEELGSRTAQSIAKNILASAASKGLGGAVEGALLTAPTGLTESVLGDPDEAAETIMAGVGFGGLLGGGGELTKDLLKLGKQSLGPSVEAASNAVLGEGDSPAKSIARKVAKFFTGVDEDDLQYVVQNLDRVNQVGQNYSKEGIKDLVDSSVSKYADNLDMAKAAAQNAKAELDQAYQSTKMDLTSQRAPRQVADELLGAIEGQKSVLGDLSVQADNALAESGVTLEKSRLTDFIDNLQKSIGAGKEGALIGDEAVSTSNKLKNLKSRIEDGLPGEIDGPTLRDVLQQVRSDINYNQAAGEFNDTLNKVRKSFTENVSSILKDQSPEYAGLMNKMSDISQNLQKMSKTFGTPEKAINSLNNIFSGKAELKNELLEKFSDLTGRNWMDDLSGLKQAKDHLDLIKKGEDIRGLLLPELNAKVQAANDTLQKAQDTYSVLKRLTPERTQSIIERQGYKNASIEDRRALENLSDLEGQDYNTLIKDYSAYDAFNKSSVNGSRRAVIGGAAGSLIGGPVGTALGATAGGILDLYGGKILKAAIDANKDVSGLLFAEKAMKRTAQKLDEVPQILDRMSSGKKNLPPMESILKGGINRIYPSEDGKKDQDLKARQLERFMDDASKIVANPQQGSSTIAGLTTPIANKGAPNIGGALNGKMLKGVQYLYQSAPKAPRPRNPFAPNVKFRPSDFDLSAWNQKVQVVEDPFSVLGELERGTLTRNHMDALKNVYPGLYRMIQQKVVTAASDSAKPMPYSDRVKLSMLMEAPLDDTLTPQGIKYFNDVANQNFAQEQAQEQQAQGAANQGSSNGYKAQVNLTNQMLTGTQRLQMPS